MTELTQQQIQHLQDKILRFYEENGRELPWRKTDNPYPILVSEIMLQQTQVSRVVPKYEAWMERWPTVEDLTSADLQDVLSLWKGLGYNNRAKRLRNSARKIVEEYDGRVPDDIDELQELPGVGPYTARAVCIFAHNQNLVTVDANIRRVLIHELGLDEETGDDELYQIAEQLLPEGRSRDWHNALMDYGAMEKTSRKTGIRPRTTQSRFKGSRRYYRAKILKAVLEQPQTAEQLRQEFDADVDGILADLEKEGMVRQNGAEYRVND